MAYSKFTYKKVRAELDIHNEMSPLFLDLVAVEASEGLLNMLKMHKKYALFSEKARSEAIVFPVLAEICQRNGDNLSLYSGAILMGDDSKELNGECDFILSKGKQDFELQAPLFCMIEAKDNDIEKNIPQCIAQMEGARLYNEREGHSFPCIYGCVTTGTEWQFLKLENRTCFIDSNRYYIDKLENILGALQAVVDFYAL